MRTSPRLLLFLLAVAPAAHATGYYSGANGARASGRGGAFTARSDDLSAVIYNPAALARQRTTQIQVGNRFSYSAYEYTRASTLDWRGNLGTPNDPPPPLVGFAAVTNEEPGQLLNPLLGVASNLGLENWGFALAAYAPAAIAHLAFPLEGGQRYMMVAREAVMLNYTASAAWKYKEAFGVGASIQWIHVPKLEYSLVVNGQGLSGVAEPASSRFDLLSTVSGHDPFTLNAILGAWVRPAKFLELGVSGQVVPSEIKTQSTLGVQTLDPSLADQQVTLTRGGVRANNVTLSLPLPLTARFGIRYRHLRDEREVFDVELDVVYETWSRAEQFTVNGSGLVANLGAFAFDVGRVNVRKQWRDTLSVQLGGDYAILPDRVTLRSGVFIDSPVADDPYLNVDFIAGKQLGGSIGASLLMDELEIALAYEHRQQPSRYVAESEGKVYQQVPASPCQPPYVDDTCHPALLGQPAPVVNAGTYRALSHALSLDVLYRF